MHRFCFTCGRSRGRCITKRRSLASDTQARNVGSRNQGIWAAIRLRRKEGDRSRVTPCTAGRRSEVRRDLPLLRRRCCLLDGSGRVGSSTVPQQVVQRIAGEQSSAHQGALRPQPCPPHLRATRRCGVSARQLVERFLPPVDAPFRVWARASYFVDHSPDTGFQLRARFTELIPIRAIASSATNQLDQVVRPSTEHSAPLSDHST